MQKTKSTAQLDAAAKAGIPALKEEKVAEVGSQNGGGGCDGARVGKTIKRRTNSIHETSAQPAGSGRAGRSRGRTR